MAIIEPLSSQPSEAIESLLDIAFGTDRHGRTAYTIRRGMRPMDELGYAALGEDGTLRGLIQSWPVALHEDGTGREIPLVMVGPVAVRPEWQHMGYGRAMMDKLVADADRFATAPLMMIGDPEYYQRFWNFTATATAGWRAPGPVEQRRLLARAVPGAPELDPQTKGLLGPRTA